MEHIYFEDDVLSAEIPLRHLAAFHSTPPAAPTRYFHILKDDCLANVNALIELRKLRQNATFACTTAARTFFANYSTTEAFARLAACGRLLAKPVHICTTGLSGDMKVCYFCRGPIR